MSSFLRMNGCFNRFEKEIEFISSWQTDNTGTSADDEITIPLTTGPNNFDVDWGDGTQSLGVTQITPLTHSYAVTGGAGTYNVTITGQITGFRFNNGGDRRKILNIPEWGPLRFTDDGGAFYGCTNLTTITATDTPDLTGITTLSSWFRNCFLLKNINAFNTWDLSSVEIATSMLHSATAYYQVLPALPSLTDGSFMLFGATSYDQVLPALPSLTDGGAMLFGATSYNQILPALPSLMDGGAMLQGATAYNQVFPALPSLTSGQGMLREATSYNQILPAMPLLSNGFAMLFGATSYNQILPALPSLTDGGAMLQDATAFDQSLASMNVSNMTDATNMLLNVTLSTVNYDATWVAWGGLTLKTGVPFHGGNSTYTLLSAADTARSNAITIDLWTVIDNGGV